MPRLRNLLFVLATLPCAACAGGADAPEPPAGPRTSAPPVAASNAVDASNAAAASAAVPASASAAASAAAPEAPLFRSATPVSIWIRGGDVIDGASPRRRRADVVIDGAVIVHVGRVAPDLVARETVDASGLVVTPGFIDAHAHADPFGSGEQLLAQGVTTIVVGQDGFSPRERIGSFLDKVQASRPALNVATLVGHHSVRTSAGVGAGKAPSDASITKMVGLVDQGMRQGAFGLSTGLEYEPGRLAGADELARIAVPVGKRGGVVMSHLRSEDDDKIEASLAELFDQCKEAKARAHVAHLKIVLGKGEARAKRVLDLFDEARAAGVSVTADLYPYTASYTTVSILFPPFAKAPNDYTEARAQRRDELRRYLRDRVTTRNGPEATTFGTGRYAGKTLAEVAAAERRPFEDVLIDLGPRGAEAAYFVMDEAVMEAFFRDGHVMIGTDGGGGGRHPRAYGSFARVLARLVRDRQLVTLEEAVRKMSSLPAQTLGLDARGTLEPGSAADVAIFDPKEVEDTATFERPYGLAKGMKLVLVNGEITLRDGRPTRARAGRALRKGLREGTGG